MNSHAPINKPVFLAVGKRAMWFALAAAPIFTLIAITQILFVRHETRQTIIAEQKAWAEEISKQVAFEDHWNLEGYRNALIDVPEWFLITTNGLVIDIEGFIPGFLPNVILPDDSIIQTAKTISTEAGENWRLLGKRFGDRTLVVGTQMIESRNDTNAMDRRLATNLSRFGATVIEATGPVSRKIDADVDYAIVRNSGEIIDAGGGIPLHIAPAFISGLPDGERIVVSGKKRYMIWCTWLHDSQNRTVGMIFIPREVTFVEKAQKIEAWFSAWVAVILWVLVVMLSIPFVHDVIRRQKHLSLLTETLQKGELEENHRIEFKPAYQWDSARSQKRDELRLDFFLKPVSGFLNADGGTLLVGVQDDGAVCGVEPDLLIVNDSTDRMRHEMLQLLSAKVGPGLGRFVQIDFAVIGGPSPKKVCLVSVEQAPRPVFVKWLNNEEHFYVRDGNRTQDLDFEGAYKHIRTKWN